MKIKKIVKGAYYVFHDSPAKREDYITKTGSAQFPQYFFMGVLLQILLSKFLCYVLDFTEKQTTHYTDIQQKLV